MTKDGLQQFRMCAAEAVAVVEEEGLMMNFRGDFLPNLVVSPMSGESTGECGIVTCALLVWVLLV